MKSTLKIGSTGTLSATVGPGQTITLGNQPDATVFSTPSMINLMEHAAREALVPHLDAGEESVGIDVQVQHSSATPTGSSVHAEATVTSIEKNVIAFDLVARDSWGEIGRGEHRRAIIRTEGFARRLAKEKPNVPNPSGELPPFDALQVREKGRLLHVTLNRPAKRNAISSQMTADLERLVEWLAANNSRVGVVILSGSGESFCAGDDVTDLHLDDAEACRSLSLRRGELYERITCLPQIFIAAINGITFGGGFVAACACDLRFASHEATFALPEVQLGWPPNYGIGIVESVIGRGHALRLSLTGKTLSARQAEQIGIVHEVVASSRLESTVRREAERISKLPPTAVAATKQLFRVHDDRSDEATAAFLRCLDTPAAKASIDRFGN